MKTQNILLSLILMLLLVFSACREVTVTTKVNPDGTFTRIITVTGDSSDVFKTNLPFPIDETWAQMSSKDTSDSTKYIMTYTRTYRNSNELNKEIKSDTGSYRNLERNISVTKKFRFFFSYLTFKEVYKSINPFTNLDYHEYLSEEDIRWYSGLKIPVTPVDSILKKDAEDKVLAFLAASATSEVESIIRNGIKRLDNPLLNSVDISVYHDSLFKKIEGFDFKGENDFAEYYSKWSGNEAFSLLNDMKPPILEDFTKKIDMVEAIFELEGYTEEVEMPGLITGTNSAMLKGNQVRWEFQPMAVIVSDFEMYAESRVINYWAFVLAGIILLALVVLLVIKGWSAESAKRRLMTNDQ
jgi:hypothetical protein